MSIPWFLQAEDAWRASLGRIGGVLCMVAGRLRADPSFYAVSAACLYLWALAFKLVPLERMTGVPLSVAAGRGPY
ncbi:hypothetical protein DND132_1775 [Pseudodesulfovibrio mercurii]|uniref:Uncharacterized protein n=1 Tax=Pseudodesulfovibrio mercurii TaxID=641491 RepID=F0JFY5_9BACT|nr:hypothetical protein [Pseudodesulfovibrio mercurii]EGB14981.1 hypothetical protein DND132_1775 [Pseudodesulfovibrio mercurii]